MTLSWQGITTIATIGLLFGVLSLNKYNDTLVIFIAYIFLWNINKMSSNDALGGFGNSGMLTVGVLFVNVHILSRTNAINSFCSKVFGNSKSPRVGMTRFLILVNVLSAFLNNTPLVALMMPIVRDWARKHNFPRSKFLIPLSYAAITGGMITVIGTSTNLLVQGILVQRKLKPMGFFDLALVALPMATISTIFLVTIGYWILPDNGIGMLGKATQTSEDYLTEICVSKDFSGIGSPIFTVLKKLKINKSSLVQVWRKNMDDENCLEIDGIEITTKDIEMVDVQDDVTSISLLSSLKDKFMKLDINQINDGVTIREGDRLILSCKLDTLQNFRRFKTNGLSIGDVHPSDMKNSMSEFCEIVVSHRNPHIGKPVNCDDFRNAYSCGVVGARRHGVDMTQFLDNTVLKPGDTLLVLTSPTFSQKFKNSHDFYVVCTVGNVLKPLTWWDYFPIVIFMAMISLPAAEIITMEQSAMTVAALAFIFRWIDMDTALEVIDWSLLIMIASSIGISRAMELSGLGLEIANFLKSLNTSLWTINFLVYLVALIMTEIVTNNAAAAIIMPIALDIAKVYSASYRPFAITVMMASSCGFAVPFGYATHLMVMSPGGYKFLDFIKIGIPLDIIYLVGCALLVPILYPF